MGQHASGVFLTFLAAVAQSLVFVGGSQSHVKRAGLFFAQAGKHAFHVEHFCFSGLEICGEVWLCRPETVRTREALRPRVGTLCIRELVRDG
jgi:hypothetical protein